MTAKILTFVLPLLAPTVVYLIWMTLRAMRAGKPEPKGWRSWPWIYLTGGGFALAAVVTVVLGFVTADAERGTYVPPHMDDGELVPGEFVPEPEQTE